MWRGGGWSYTGGGEVWRGGLIGGGRSYTGEGAWLIELFTLLPESELKERKESDQLSIRVCWWRSSRDLEGKFMLEDFPTDFQLPGFASTPSAPQIHINLASLLAMMLIIEGSLARCCGSSIYSLSGWSDAKKVEMRIPGMEQVLVSFCRPTSEPGLTGTRSQDSCRMQV